jgi:hypothetical protein
MRRKTAAPAEAVKRDALPASRHSRLTQEAWFLDTRSGNRDLEQNSKRKSEQKMTLKRLHEGGILTPNSKRPSMHSAFGMPLEEALDKHEND